jgi:hypothetical protein
LDHQIKDRRLDRRLAPSQRAEMRATLRPGCVVLLVDVSTGGALVEAPRPLRPGARVHFQVIAGVRRFAVPAHITRCLVWSLDPAGVIYRGALRFDHRVDWAWAEPTRNVQAMPEHGGPTGETDGNHIPGFAPLTAAGSRHS